MALGVLGPLLPAVITRPAQRRLLSILLLHRGSDVAGDILIDCMWGNEPPRSARNALYVHVGGLRKAIAHDIITTTAHGYRIDPDSYGFDVSDFDRLSAAAHNEADPSERLRFIACALDLWRGDPYQELAGDAFALPEIVRLEERWLELVELRMQVLLVLGLHDEAIPQLRELVERFPLRERLHGDLMLALYRCGRQAEALRQFQSVQRILGEEIGIEPGAALRELEERILFQDPNLGRADSRPTPHNLPTFTTSFVGRDEEIVSMVEALSASRLVSIVGGPGFGKTRLAVELGHALLEDHQGGVWFAPLAEARTGEDIAALIATATRYQHNVSGLGDLATALAPRPALLILDNCEHVVDECATFGAAVLAAGGDLRVVVTSRRRLGIDGERVWRLDPLPVPVDSTNEMTPLDAAANVSVRLFVDRAQAVDRTFALSADSTPEIIELSKRLAGIPLAIELAARWVPSLGTTEIVSLLDLTDTGATDSDEPQVAGSLRAAIDWSLSLLPLEDRTLLADMAVFKGSFGFPDVESVCAGGRGRVQLFTTIARIVDSSLLLAVRRDDGLVRYRMLVPIREFLIVTHGEAWNDLEETHARHYLSKALTWRGSRFSSVVDLTLIDDDIDNLRASLDIGLDRGWADDVAMALVPLNYYFTQRYLTWEAVSWLERVTAHDLRPSVEASALRALGSGAEVLGELKEAVDMFERAIALFETLDDSEGRARCLVSLAGAHAHRGDWADGFATAQEAHRLVESLGNESATASAMYYMAENLNGQGDPAAALPYFLDAAEAFELCGELGRASYVMSRLTLSAVLDGDETLGRVARARATELDRSPGSDYHMAKALSASALLDATWGNVRNAAAKLLEVNERIKGSHPDRIFDFLLPAAAVLVRTGQWARVAGLVFAVRQVISVTEAAIPVPWEITMDQWAASAVAELGEDEDRFRRGARAATMDNTTYTTLTALREIESRDA